MLIESQNFLSTNEEQGALLITILLSMSVFGGVEINDEDTLETQPNRG